MQAERLTGESYAVFRRKYDSGELPRQRLGQAFVNYFGIRGCLADELWGATYTKAERVISRVLSHYQI